MGAKNVNFLKLLETITVGTQSYPSGFFENKWKITELQLLGVVHMQSAEGGGWRGSPNDYGLIFGISGRSKL